MCEHFIVFAISIPLSLHLQALSISQFNGLNFFNWCEQVQFNLCVLDLDLTLQKNPDDITTTTSSDEEKFFHKTLRKIKQINLNVYVDDNRKKY